MKARPIALWLLLAVLCAAAGCAALQGRPQPQLRLSPASLGHSLAEQQRLTFRTGAATQQIEAILEVDADGLRLAMVGLGQTLARLEWDGHELHQVSAPGWPSAVSGERVLSDLQLMLWPAPAVRAALPEGWTLQETAGQRLLLDRGEPVVRIDLATPGRAELHQMRLHYSVLVESRAIAAGTP